MAAADVYFACARSLVPGVRATGARRVEYLPFGWDGEVFPFAEEPESGDEVVFVGGWDREREELLAALARRFAVKVWGPGYWRTRTRLGSSVRRCWQGRAVYGPEAAAILRRARIAINIVRPADGDATNMRTFEVPGCGGFLLSKRTTGAMEVLPEEEAGAYFGDVPELLDRVDRYLADREARRRLARRAHEIVAGSHTYVDRLRNILDVYRDWLAGGKGSGGRNGRGAEPGTGEAGQA